MNGTPPNLRITVVSGGSSAEADVSRSSGSVVAEALRTRFSSVQSLEFNAATLRELATNPPDVVFPVLHGPPGEDGTFQGFLESLHIPYVGSGVLGSACAMNKAVAKEIFRRAGLPVATDVVVTRADLHSPDLDRKLDGLGADIVVKPTGQGSALGVHFVSGAKAVRTAIQDALLLSDAVLAEERIYGREITAGVLDLEKPEPLPVIEIVTPAGTWYDFEHRYTAGLSEHRVPADLPEEVYAKVQDIATSAHTALGCRDLSRADFVVSDNRGPIILEVNTLPGMTKTSLYPDAAKAAGYPFDELMQRLVLRAFRRLRGSIRIPTLQAK